MASKNGAKNSNDDEDEFVKKIKAAAAKKEKLAVSLNLRKIVPKKIQVEKEDDSFFCQANEILSKTNFEKAKNTLRTMCNASDNFPGGKEEKDDDEAQRTKEKEEIASTADADVYEILDDADDEARLIVSVTRPRSPSPVSASSTSTSVDFCVLDDSDEEKRSYKPAFDEQVMIFVRANGKAEKHILHKDDKLEVIFKSMAQSMHLPINDVSILRNGCEFVSQLSTPRQLGMGKIETMECVRTASRDKPIVTASKNDFGMKEATKDENCINLKFQHGGRRCVVEMAVNKLDSFEIIKEQYIKGRELDPSTTGTLKFMFDGEKIEATNTPDDLDMEDDDCIDVML